MKPWVRQARESPCKGGRMYWVAIRVGWMCQRPCHLAITMGGWFMSNPHRSPFQGESQGAGPQG
jgi:hypothetical protein